MRDRWIGKKEDGGEIVTLDLIFTDLNKIKEIQYVVSFTKSFIDKHKSLSRKEFKKLIRDKMQEVFNAFLQNRKGRK